MTRWIVAALLVGGGLGALVMLAVHESSFRHRPTAIANAPSVAVESPVADGAVWAISLVRARPGQRERLERFLRANWLALDQQALEQGKISAYRLLRADADKNPDAPGNWDYAVTIEYANREAMNDFVPVYLQLLREHPQTRVDGLDFADLGEVVQQKVVTPVTDESE